MHNIIADLTDNTWPFGLYAIHYTSTPSPQPCLTPAPNPAQTVQSVKQYMG